MKKKILFFAAFVFTISVTTSAQTYTETFDSNSLEWTECGYKNDDGNAVIENGIMKINSYRKAEVTSNGNGFNVSYYNTSFETHCYAPIDIKRPFTISSDVTVKNKEQVGLIFNYRDFGNYYAFAMTDEYVIFYRYADGKLVGKISQGIKWKKKTKQSQTWVLKSNGEILEFMVNDEPIMKIRYMPLEYTGFGYYTIGKCTLQVDQVVFKQGL